LTRERGSRLGTAAYSYLLSVFIKKTQFQRRDKIGDFDRLEMVTNRSSL